MARAGTHPPALPGQPLPSWSPRRHLVGVLRALPCAPFAFHRPLLHPADPTPVKSFVTHDTGLQCALWGPLGGHPRRCLGRMEGGQRPGQQRSDSRASAPLHLLAEQTLRREVPSSTRQSWWARGAWPDSPPHPRRPRSCPARAAPGPRVFVPPLLTADNAADTRPHLCLQRECRGMYVAYNGRM